MVASAQAKVEMAKKEYYPISRSGRLLCPASSIPRMWNVTATINILFFAKTKQREGVLERKRPSGSQKGGRGGKTDGIIRPAGQLCHAEVNGKPDGLYKDGLIPKAYQNFELALAGYVTARWRRSLPLPGSKRSSIMTSCTGDSLPTGRSRGTTGRAGAIRDYGADAK